MVALLKPPTLAEIDDQIAAVAEDIRKLEDDARDAAREFSRERARLNMEIVALRSLKREIEAARR